MLDLNHCEGCPLDGLYERPAEAMGDTSAPYMLVSDTPSKSCYQKGILIQDNAMAVLKSGLRAARFKTQDFCMVPQIRCPFDPDEYSTKEKRLIQQKCREHLLDDIHEFKPEAIIPMGAEPSRQVLSRAVKITKVRGVLSQSADTGTQVFPILSPSMVAMYPQHDPVFKADCETFGRLVDNNFSAKDASDQILGEYEIVTDLTFLIEQKPELVFFDIEATHLDFFHTGTHTVREYDPDIHGKEFDPDAAILTMQFCIEPGKAYMLVWDHPENPIPMRRKAKLLKQITQLLCRPEVTVVGQNVKFDCNFVWHHLGIRFKIGGDTLMLAALLDENMISKSQDTLVKHYVPEMAGYADHFNATVDKGRMWEVPLAQLVDYGCGDVESGLLLYYALLDLVEQDKKLLTHYRRVSLPGLNTFVTVERLGLGVDHDALAEFEELMEETVAREEESLLSQVPKAIKRKHIDKGLKFSRSDFTLDVLFYHKDGFRLKPKVFTKTTAKLSADRRVPSTSSKDHLPYFFDECPFTQELAQYMKDSRLLGTNIKGFQNKYIHDGLVRPSYRLDVTVTGRTSCVRADTPIVTNRGVVRADEVAIGDMLYTHELRWMPVTALFRKPPAIMYELYLSNGEVLPVTAHHRVMLDSGLWADVGFILERLGYAISEQRTHEESASCEESSHDIPAGACDRRGSGREVWGQPCNGTGNDPCVYDGRGVQYFEGYEIPSIEAGGEKPAIREALGLGLRGWEGVFDTPRGRCAVLRPSYSNGRVSGDTPLTDTTNCEYPSHRREQEEQQYRQSMYDEPSRTPENPREVRDAGGRLTIEKVVCAGVHRVYDFEVAEDHSYLACGVFNHNSENPNGQNFPKRGPNAKAYRRIFVPPPGYYVLEADLSQAELRIAADMANDREMLRIYQTGGDIHKATACIALGITLERFALLPKEEQKDWRTKAKAINFGFLYGMGWRKFIGYAKTQYGVVFTEEEAQHIREAFFDRYSALPEWHMAMREFAHRNGYVRSYSGRIRHLPMIDSEDSGVQSEAERQAINSPVQEFGSALGVMALGRLNEEIDHRYLVPIAFVHDAIYCYVPYRYAEWGAKTLKHYMQTNPLDKWFNLRMKCPIVADVSLGLNLGDTYELEGFSLDTPYDFGSLWNEEEQKGLKVPTQRVPPNNGRQQGSIYTLPDWS